MTILLLLLLYSKVTCHFSFYKLCSNYKNINPEVFFPFFIIKLSWSADISPKHAHLLLIPNCVGNKCALDLVFTYTCLHYAH